MTQFLQNLTSIPHRYDASSVWLRLVKNTIARFARGNISAQNARVQIADERICEHLRALEIADKMKRRFDRRVR